MSRRTAFGAMVVAALLAMVATAVPASGAVRDASQAGKVVIWADRDRKPAVEQVANAWARTRGVTVEVVQKDFDKIRDDLKTVQAANAPDVIVGAHDWTGELAANGLVLPLFPSAA